MTVLVYHDDGRVSVYRNVRGVREAWEGGIEIERSGGPDVTMGGVLKAEILCG